jgi:hypothetical protein
MRHLATESHRAEQSDVQACRKLFKGIIAQAARDLVRMKPAREKLALLEAIRTPTKSEIQKMNAVRDYVVHLAAERSNGQALSCQTLSDEAASLATMLEAAHGDFSDATSLQRLWLIRKLAKVAMMLAGGDR